MPSSRPFRVALLDLNNGTPNQGMYCLERIMTELGNELGTRGIPLEHGLFRVRDHCEMPDLSYDAYVCSGGPGSPFDGIGLAWESKLFKLWDQLITRTARQVDTPKFCFGICHSFELMVRFFDCGDIVELREKILGINSVAPTPDGERDELFAALGHEFFGFEARSWLMPVSSLREGGFGQPKILAVGQPKGQVELGIAALRFTPEIVATIFHPEGDRIGIVKRLSQPAAKRRMISVFGEAGYERLLNSLEDPEYIDRTRRNVIPGFLLRAAQDLVEAGVLKPSMDPLPNPRRATVDEDDGVWNAV